MLRVIQSDDPACYRPSRRADAGVLMPITNITQFGIRVMAVTSHGSRLRQSRNNDGQRLLVFPTRALQT